jgi:hypothetical protein
MSESKTKGDALEHAVQCIEEAMHRSVPGLKGANAIIERNKIIRKNGVPYEIDLWVRLNPDTLYETAHILECKNWQQPVGTDEVAKLSLKKRVLQAATATIIAREFTAAAEALAPQEQLALHRFSDNFWSPLDSLQCAATTHEVGNAAVTVHYRHPSPDNPTTLDYRTVVCRSGSQIAGLYGFLSPQIDRHIRAVGTQDPRSRLEGLHRGRTEFGCAFELGEFFMDDREVSYLTVALDYVMNVQHARVVVKFDVEHRGGFIRMEYPPGTFGQKEVALEILTKPTEKFKKKLE